MLSEGTYKRRRTTSLTAEKMWLVIFAIVVYHEVSCAPGQLLSEAADRALVKHRLLVNGFTIITAAHLLNWLPNRVDPYHWIFLIQQRTKGIQQ